MPKSNREARRALPFLTIAALVIAGVGLYACSFGGEDQIVPGEGAPLATPDSAAPTPGALEPGQTVITQPDPAAPEPSARDDVQPGTTTTGAEELEAEEPITTPGAAD